MTIDDLRGRIVFDSDAFPSRAAAEIDLDLGAHGLSHSESHRMDGAPRFAVMCTREALANSGLGLGAVDPGRPGVSVGSAVGAAITLPEDRQTPAGLRAATEEIPHSSCLAKARAIPTEIAAQPVPAEVVATLKALAHGWPGHRAIPTGRLRRICEGAV